MKIYETTSADFAQNWQKLVHRNTVSEVPPVVLEILADVEQNGPQAVLAWSARLDGTTYANMDEAIGIPDESWLEGVDKPVLEALTLAAQRIRDYHERQKPRDFSYSDNEGNRMGNRWLAMERVGLYVPGGTAAYPSSVLMNAIPAKVAGVDEIWMVTPPAKMKAEVKAAAFLAGVDKVVGIGGVQAVAMLAMGAGVPRVDIIVGPGNKYVAAAKQQLFGRVAIDMIAGPSEILVLADGSVPAEWVAADLLSQAEHDTAAVCGLLALDEIYVQLVAESLERMAAQTPRREVAMAAVRDNAFAVIVRDRNEMLSLANTYAAEHLELAVREPRDWLDQIRNAGSVFMGAWTPEAVGDYLAGPNHVLPTAGSARFFSALGVDTFMKRCAFTEWTERGLQAHGEAIVALAECEELIAHADSVRIRTRKKS